MGSVSQSQILGTLRDDMVMQGTAESPTDDQQVDHPYSKDDLCSGQAGALNCTQFLTL